MTNPYRLEALDSDEDNGTIVENVEQLSDAVVGHRILSVAEQEVDGNYNASWATVITLDNGKRVEMFATNDCCAYTSLNNFLLHPDKVDHIITGVGTTDGYQKWHVFADFGDVLELDVVWSCGNPFYYGYGFDIIVRDIPVTS